MSMKEVYFTITGMNHYLGSDFLKKGMKVKIVGPEEVVERFAGEIRAMNKLYK
jgi:hypothetical protein